MLQIKGRRSARIGLGALALLAAFLLAPHAARAAWTNGQAATVVLGQSDFTSSGSATTQSGLASAGGVCVDKSSGKAFVADPGNNRVLRFSSAAAVTNGANAEAAFGQTSYTSDTSGLSQSALYQPLGCAITDSGDLWVVDNFNRRVLLYSDAANKPEFGALADKVLGQADFVSASTTSNQATIGGLPRGVAVSPDGSTLWVADSSNNRILRWDNVSGKSSGANADSVLGQSDYTSEGAALSATGLSFPIGLALDASVNLYVTDASNNRVLRYDNAASLGVGAAASGVLGAADFVTAGSGAVSASSLLLPYGVAVGSDGRLYISDGQHNRVLIFNSPASKANGADADYVLGQTDFTNAGSGAATSATFSSALGISANPSSGVLYIGDAQNNRVLGFYNAELIPRTLTVSPSAGGSVSADSGAIASCASTSGVCSGEYAYGATIILTATPSAGYATSWTSGCSSTSGNICTVSGISANTTVNVAFAVAAGVPLGGATAYAGFGLALLCLAAVVLRAGRNRSN